MKELTHKQARRCLQLDLDGLLGDDQRLDLEAHLAGCEACRAESESFSALTARLRSEFHERWDAHDGPSQHVTANVRSQTRRIIMSNKVKWGLGALGGAVALVLLGLGLNFLFSRLQERSIAASVTPMPGNFMPVAAPNAEKRLLAFTMERNGQLDIYTVRADGSDLTNLTGDSNGSNPYWSPDGKRIAFNRNVGSQSQVFVMDADGSNVVQLTDDGDFNKLAAFEEGRESGFDAWSPDGSKLVFVKLNYERANDEGWMKLYVLDVKTRVQTPLTNEWGFYQSPAWSPDGKYVAFSSFSRFNAQGEPTRLSIHVVGADGSNPVDLTASLPDNEFAYLRYWSRDGQSVVFTTYQISRKTFKAYEARLDGALIEHSDAGKTRLLDWWEGTALTLGDNRSTLTWLREDGTQSTLDVCRDWYQSVNFSSARSSRADLFFGLQCSSAEWRLYLANEDGRSVQELLDPPLSAGDGVMVDQAWSPDDNFIAFNISSRSGNVEMFILDVAATLDDPSREPVRFNVGEIFSSVNSLSWQPVITEETLAGQPPQPYEGLVAFTSAAEDGDLDIYTMRADGSGLTNLTNNPAHDVDPYWSPDGRRIAFLSDRAGYMQVFTMNADGSDVFQVTRREADHQFAGADPWSPDGSALVFLEKTPDGKHLLYTMQANGRNGLPLVNKADIYQAVSWSPDGRHIAYVALEPVGDRTMARIHVIEADGDNDTNVTRMLPDDEDLYASNYSWTQRGRAIGFIAGRVAWENNNGKFAYYEASLDGATLVESAKTSTPMVDRWNGVTFVRGFTGETLTWLRADGTFSEFKPFKNCQMGSEPQYRSFYSRSANGYLAFGAGCPNSDLWLYWANPDGSDIRPLLASPLSGDLDLLVWSPDIRHIALTVVSSGITNLYILDVREALKAPLTPPKPIVLGGGDLPYNISWQPMR